MERVWKGFRWLLVVVGVIALTSFSIDATDTLRGSETALSGLVGSWTDSGCPAGTTELALANTMYCIDVYENSVAGDCPIANPTADIESKTNLDATDCVSRSAAEVTPWTAVNFHQAKSLCAKRGMRLPTANEWYEAALGTPADSSCNIQSNSAEAGTHAGCVSHRGAYDMVGNVWEWVDASVTDGVYDERSLPNEGYVSAAAIDGIASETSQSPNPMYDNAYFWQSPDGEHVMMRGGFYGSKEDAGVYTTHAKVASTFHSAAVGFRCIVEKQ